MNPEESRCPRCSDYDKVKEELETSKRTSDKEVKDSLKNCESQKKKLQKQLLTAGAIAIIAGTILGKDFVDTVADYIDSFNDVKNKASGLIGMVDTPQIVIEEEKKKPEDTTTKKPKEKPSTPFIYTPSLSLAQTPVYGNMKNKTFFVDLLEPYSNDFYNDITLPYSDLIPLNDMSMTLSGFMVDMPLAYDALGESVFNTPITLPYETPVAVVPGPGTLGLLGVSLIGQRSRRR